METENIYFSKYGILSTDGKLGTLNDTLMKIQTLSTEILQTEKNTNNFSGFLGFFNKF